MKILKYKKLSKGRYKVTFDTNEIILYEDVIIKNNLLLNKDINLELLEKIIEENKYYEVYNISLSYIEIKMRNEKEMRNYLEKKGYERRLIDEVINRLKEEGYINENRYIEAYINDKKNLSSDGPYKIKKNLINLEIKEDLINNYLDQIPYEFWKDKIDKIIKKRIKLMNNKSITIIKNKLRIELYNLGYSNELIDDSLNNIEKDDKVSIEKEFIKGLNKYKKKYEGERLIKEIKNYLYKKGYDIDDINSIIRNNLENY